MMHWAIDVVEAVTDTIVASGTTLGADKVQHIVWEHAPQLLEKASQYMQTGRGHKIQLRRALEDAIKETGLVENSSTVKSVMAAIQATKIPYTHTEIDKKSEKLNTILSTNRFNRKDFSQTDFYLNAVFPNTDAGLLSGWAPDWFADLLEAAARRGNNNDVFAAEVAKRIRTSEMLVQNLHSILVVAERRKDGHWEGLKKLAFQKLKEDSGLAEKLFEYMQEQQIRQTNAAVSGNEVQMSYTIEATLFDRERNPYPAALIVLNQGRCAQAKDGRRIFEDKKDYSAPVIDAVDPSQYDSLEEARKVAKQAAILTFFRHYGNLHPHDTLYTPPLIELELERAKVKRGGHLEFLRKICAGVFDIECESHPIPSQNTVPDKVVTIRVKPKEGEMVVQEAKGPEERAFDKAAKSILFTPQFRYMLSLSHEPVEMPGRRPDKDAENVPHMVWAGLELLRAGIPANAQR